VQSVFELSHIQPVKGRGKVGVLHPDNLVICPKQWNRANTGSKLDKINPRAGIAIKQTELRKGFVVSAETGNEAIVRKIELLLGEEWKTFVATLAVQKTQAEQLRAKLVNLGVDAPEWLTIDELKAQAAAHDIQFFSLTLNATSELDVLLNEVQRHGWAVGERAVYVRWLSHVQELQHSFSDVWHSDLDGLSAALVDECLQMLHGYPRPPRTEQVKNWLLELTHPKNSYPLHKSEEGSREENGFEWDELGSEMPPLLRSVLRAARQSRQRPKMQSWF
jgi:hypothetical protein